MTADRAPVRRALVSPPGGAGILQRKCACEGSDHQCDECRKKVALRRQPAGGAGPHLAPPIVQQVLRSSGAPLDGSTRSFMEARFGHDFRRVRVHTDDRAAESAQAVNALAYTVGRHIVFASGEYTASTTQGRRLLAHELTHTIQQRMVDPNVAQVGAISAADDREKEAATAARTTDFPLPFSVRETSSPFLGRQAAGGAGAQEHRFAAQGVSVVVRRSCAPAEFGFATVETGVRDAIDRIFKSDCIGADRRRQIQRNLTRHGLDFRCRRSAAIDGACAEATGFPTPANIITLGSFTFPGHPEVDASCLPLAASVLHEVVHITRGFEGEALPQSCEASCFGVAGASPDLCRSPIVRPGGAAP